MLGSDLSWRGLDYNSSIHLSSIDIAVTLLLIAAVYHLKRYWYCCHVYMLLLLFCCSYSHYEHGAEGPNQVHTATKQDLKDIASSTSQIDNHGAEHDLRKCDVNRPPL